MELSPGALRAYEAAHELASSLYAVPQHERLRIEQEDGWYCWLTRYEYRPLTRANEIRLLRIHPWESRLKTFDALVLPRCELIHVTLDSCPEYATISYAWGELDKYSPILIHEENCLTVTNSLFTAVCRLASDTSLDYWADQICINQYDLAERSEQVQLMGKIYEQSLWTIIGGCIDRSEHTNHGIE
jgi:Heterokaryon incompatibility protein (HET)